MQFQILGPLEVRRQGRQVALGAAKQRALLAILLVHANELVSTDRLIDELWPQPPETAANTLQVYVGKLRKALEPGRARGAPAEVLITRAPGYMLRVEAGQLDAERFESLLADGSRAREAGESPAAAELLRDALALWRGDALAEFTYEPFAQDEIARLEELRTIALEERLEADLALGRHTAVLGELEALVREHPLRERLRGQLMLALYRCGRQADALEVYRQTRETLDEELGLSPGPALERLQTAILRQEPALEVSIEAPAEPAAPGAPPEITAAPAEVRKTVTVIVARGLSTGGLDPEALSREDERYRAHIARTVERYGGTIAGSFGNAVMAVFGVPRVHEDDAFRAAAAALEICTAPSGDGSSAGSATRVGLATGEVLTKGSGTNELSVVGEPVTAAGELADAAAAGRGAARRGDRAPGSRIRHGRAGRDGSADRLAASRRGARTARGRIAASAARGPQTRARPAPAGVRGRDPPARPPSAHDPRHGRDREVAAGAGARRARRRGGHGPRGPLRPVRRGHHVLAAARDGQPAHRVGERTCTRWRRGRPNARRGPR